MPGPGAALEELVAASPSLAELAEAAGRAAASEAPILIVGEAGTGRTVLARALHEASARAAEPLVELDAAAIPATLFESELFGYAAGAFTGAERAMPGRVARAAGGSLLLDHVEEIPLETQPKLLRLLAERRFAPLGGGETEADVRFLAIGADDLEERVARGALRRDLYYRLEVVRLALPPLRRRRQDLERLIGFLLGDLAARVGRRPPRLAEGAWAWMEEYGWPGNVRELRNVLERALVMGDGEEIDPQPPAGRGRRPRSLVEVERREIERALAWTRGHQGRAARLLGISRKSLWERRKRHGLP